MNLFRILSFLLLICFVWCARLLACIEYCELYTKGKRRCQIFQSNHIHIQIFLFSYFFPCCFIFYFSVVAVCLVWDSHVFIHSRQVESVHSYTDCDKRRRRRRQRKEKKSFFPLVSLFWKKKKFILTWKCVCVKRFSCIYYFWPLSSVRSKNSAW